jgi:molybdate transport system permease protein
MPIDWSPLWLSLRVAGVCTGLSLIVALWLAHVLAGKAAHWLSLPLVLPPTIVAAYFLTRPGFTWQIAAAAAMVPALPYLTKAVHAAFRNLDPVYEDAARSLGASDWRIFWRVTIPLAYPPILAAASLVFARVAAEFLLTLGIATILASPVLLAQP